MDGAMNQAGNEKRRALELMLDQGLVMMHLDPRVEGVVVPERFKADPVLRLNIAYGFNLPALDVSDDGVFAILSFNRVDFACTLPWPAVFALTAPERAHEGTAWPESAPAELTPFFNDLGYIKGAIPVSLEADPVPIRERRTPPTPPPPRPPPIFEVHDGGRPDDAPDGATAAGDDEGPSPRPQLRLVKG